MRILFAVVLAVSTVPLGHARSIALTFDDGPDMKDSVAMSPEARNAAILAQLRTAGLEAALFVKCGSTDPARLALLREWGLAGHVVANHTTSHLNFNNPKITLEDFTADMLRCDEQLRKLPGYTKWFRFPYLKEGNTAEKRDGFRAFLSAAGYRSAPVSVDTSDWFYNKQLREKIKERKADNVQGLRQAYVAHLLDRADYYDALCRKATGRSADHVLLLHHNLINARFLKDVVAAFKDKGWNIITPRAAFQDPLYASAPKLIPAGESIVWALAKEKGLPELRYPAEDAEYEQAALKKFGL